MIEPALVEDLSSPSEVVAGEVTVTTGDLYCQLHYLVGRSSKEVFEAPEDISMLGTSMHFEGRWIPPGGGDAVPFEIRTTLAWGDLWELPNVGEVGVDTAGEATVVDTDVQGAVVTVNRELGALFEGVDFETMNDAYRGQQVLESLFASVSVELQLGH